ncbi:RNA polymerase sigma factor SigJ [Rhodobacteraceae bacterium D3-12]|nr:RNA polymerase sigma factor SigJ [Rhodobacteraceae bacterium D3-12]
MGEKPAIFETERPVLMALCYRMLGERAAAEDAVQEAWLRFDGADIATIESPPAWLRRVATRIAINQLKSARARRETYVGPWLPEPLIEGEGEDAGAEADYALAQECELALLWAMERLEDSERAAFILREAFDASYAEIAETLGKTEAACRQIVSRAHKRVQQSGPRFDVPEGEAQALIARFFMAAGAGDFETARRMMAPDAVAISDGGAKARAARRVLRGPEEICQVFAAIMAKDKAIPDVTLRRVRANGAPALARYIAGRLDTLVTMAADGDGRIAWVYLMRNPDKLIRAA